MRSRHFASTVLALLALGAIAGPSNVEVRAQQTFASAPTATLERPLWFGYFLAYSDRYAPDSRHLPQNVTVVDGEPGAIPRAAADVPVIIGGTDAELDAARDVWSRVVAVFVNDEASLDGLEAQARRAHEGMRARGYAPRPVVGYVTRQHLRSERWHVPCGLDWFAPDLYVDPPAQDDLARAQQELLTTFRAWQQALPPDLPWLPIAQAYNRNYEWTRTDTLTALQPVYLDLAREEPRIVGLLLFSANRPGGTRDHPELRAAHSSMFRAIPGTPDVDDVTRAPGANACAAGDL